MYENMVDVLIYLYENYMDGESRPPVDQDELESELSDAGFSSSEISEALTWLDELASRMASTRMASAEDAPRGVDAMRIYTDAECRKLDLDARGMLLFLEQSGILDPLSRELVIDRALAIEQNAVSVDELKWIVLLVLLNRPGRESALSQMEDLIYGDPVCLH
jgi:Smg protein